MCRCAWGRRRSWSWANRSRPRWRRRWRSVRSRRRSRSRTMATRWRWRASLRGARCWPPLGSPTREGKVPMSEQVTQRKAEHVSVALQQDVAAPQEASWADVRLVHRALPEVDLDEIDTGVELLGHRLRHPVFVSSLTGGHPDVAGINARLAALAEEYGLAMGVGSQRAGLADAALAGTYGVARERAPHALLIANIGAPQLIAQHGKPPFTVTDARRAVEMIGAGALAIHLNFLQEAAQPEGDRNARGCLAALRTLTAGGGVPVIAKETGAGVSFEQARALAAAGVAAVGVGGAGG